LYKRNCKVVVLNPIDAVDDNPVAVNTGVNPKVVFNVTDNDTLNTVLVSPRMLPQFLQDH
jgi:hypothetical protein